MNEQDKPYELHFEERPHYLYARITSPTIDRTTALSYLHEVANKCTELKYRRLMLERDIPVMLPDADLFFTTNDFVRLTTGVKIAFLNPHITNEDAMKFAIMIGTNRGARFDVFSDAPTAESWLLR